VQSYQIQDSFGLDNLTCVERDEPGPPGPGEVTLRMRAASLNYRDIMMVRGTYNPRQPLPLVPCSDGVGIVEEVGEGVERVSVGDRVMPIFAQGWRAGEPSSQKFRTSLGGPLDGTLREKMCVEAASVVRAPEHLSDAEAATLPCAALTAWSALVTRGEVTAGDWVLVQGTGGVSIFALQIAQLLGANVIATSSSDEKLERVREMGAAETIHYVDNPEWGKIARSMTPDERGVDHIIEVGGADTLEQSLRAVRVGGHISQIGILSGASQKINLVPILMRQIRVQGIFVGHREGLEALVRAVETHEVRPVVDRVFDFEDARQAFEYVANGRHFGKICIQIDV
jgi:NADPH:quinone reductase-like Zn-dependent oxidoreductase